MGIFAIYAIALTIMLHTFGQFVYVLLHTHPHTHTQTNHDSLYVHALRYIYVALQHNSLFRSLSRNCVLPDFPCRCLQILNFVWSCNAIFWVHLFGFCFLFCFVFFDRILSFDSALHPVLHLMIFLLLFWVRMKAYVLLCCTLNVQIKFVCFMC